MALTQVTSGGGIGDAGSSSSSTVGTAGIVIAWEYKQERGYYGFDDTTWWGFDEMAAIVHVRSETSTGQKRGREGRGG